MPELAVPKLNNNDDTYLLLEWLFADGDTVPAGAEVAVVETSKASEDLVCDEGGVLHRLAAERVECRPGEVIGLLFTNVEEQQRYLADRAADRPADNPAADGAADGAAEAPGLVVTEAAQALMAEHGITAQQLRVLGKRVIKGSDVTAFLAAGSGPIGSTDPVSTAAPGATSATGSVVEVGRHQRAVATVVDRSHRTIPAAYVLVKVDVAAALELAAQETERGTGTIGLPELVVRAVARLRESFPLCFARLDDDGSTATVAAASHIAVTMDVGRGLFLPVVRDADTRPLSDIAANLMEHRIKALRGTFGETDLADAAIAVSLNNDDGVVFAVPIVFPGMACMVTVGGVAEELVLGPDGAVRTRRVCHLGLAYDHRIVNGRDAMQFVRRVADGLTLTDSPSQKE